MEPVLAVLPELEGVGMDPQSTPPRRPGHRDALELGLEGPDPLIQLGPTGDDLALARARGPRSARRGGG